jgi:hypothetical protein
LLIASIDETYDESGDVSEALSFYLSPTSASATGEFAYDCTEEYNQRISLLTECQREVVIKVLREYVALGWETEETISETVARLRNTSIAPRNKIAP